MAPKAKQSSGTPKTQSMLNFSTTKSRASTLAKKAVVTKAAASRVNKTRRVSSGSEISVSSKSTSSASDDEDPIEDSFEQPESKPEPKANNEARAQTVSKQLAATKLSQEAEQTREKATITQALAKRALATEVLPELNDKDPKWNRAYGQAKLKMGNLQSIHAENQTKIHDILRVFDNSYEYGPCVGMSRLDRWERAEAMGLKPPREVYDILNTKQGNTLEEYTQSVFYGQV